MKTCWVPPKLYDVVAIKCLGCTCSLKVLLLSYLTLSLYTCGKHPTHPYPVPRVQSQIRNSVGEIILTMSPQTAPLNLSHKILKRKWYLSLEVSNVIGTVCFIKQLLFCGPNKSPPPLQKLKACPLSPCLTLPKIVMLSMIGKGWAKENGREMKLYPTS